MPTSFIRLDGELLLASVQTLRGRVAARFPESSLKRITDSVCEVTEATRERAKRTSRPHFGLRLTVGVLLAGILLAVVVIARNLQYDRDVQKVGAFAQFLDATLNATALLGGISIFLITLESRIKRNRTLEAVHELRSLAHIIDMHQLTKVPDHYLPHADRTPFSPPQKYSLFELGRYLDYCSELLAIVGKIAVLYVEHSSDPVVLDAVDQIEDLTNGLARKVWQKMSFVNRISASLPQNEATLPHELPLVKHHTE